MRKFITLFLMLSIIFAALGIFALAQGVQTNIYIPAQAPAAPTVIKRFITITRLA